MGEEFWARVWIVPDCCWLWDGMIHKEGYGRYSLSDKEYLAHRTAWELTNGPIPLGLCVLHRCDVRLCVRPDHLFLGTRRDNILDAVAKGRNYKGDYNRAKAHCRRGHLYDLENTHIWNGHRSCRACRRETARLRKQRQGVGCASLSSTTVR